MLATGLPIGTEGSSWSRSTVHDVTSTVVSVRAVEVHQACRRETVVEAPGEVGAQGLAAGEHEAQAVAAVERLVEEDREQGRHELRDRDAVRGDGPAQGRGILVVGGAGEHQVGTRRQRPEQLPDRGVEGDRRLLQHPVRGAQRGRRPAASAGG